MTQTVTPRRDNKTSVAEMVRSVLNPTLIMRVIRQFFHSDPALYYENLGFDIVEGKSDKDAAEHAGPIWQNCGIWAGVSTYDSAARALCERLAEFGDFAEAGTMLDVGFGFGEQDLYWAHQFPNLHIEGINITPFQVEVAKRRAIRDGLEDRLRYRVGDAVNLQVPPDSFDRVVALQSAFQFNTRAAFVAEACKALVPGGRLVLTDMILQDQTAKRFSLWSWFTRRRVGWQHSNVYDHRAYAAMLQRQGFVDIRIVSIADEVFPGMKSYISRRYGGEKIEDIRIDAHELEDVSAARALWQTHYGVDDYVLVSATKLVGKRA